MFCEDYAKLEEQNEKLVELLVYAYSLPMNEAGDYNENIKWQKETEQALKKAEKP